MTCRHGSPSDKCRICSLEKELADQKAITELAVKGLKEIRIKGIDPLSTQVAIKTISEIERIKSEQT